MFACRAIEVWGADAEKALFPSVRLNQLEHTWGPVDVEYLYP